MLRRRELMADRVELPAGYRRCKYLESSGHQWIVTNIYTSSFEKCEICVMYTTDSIIGFYGLHSNSSYGMWHDLIFCKKQPNGLAFYPSSNKSTDVIYVYKNIMYTVLFEVNGTTAEFCINGDTRSLSGFNPCEIGPVGLFRINAIGHNYEYSVCKIFGLCHEKNGIVDANYIPAIRKSDNKPGMYDTASNLFFTNIGTGEFGYELMDGAYVAPV